MSRFAKFLFVATSLAPVLGAFAVNDLAEGRTLLQVLPYLVVAVLLVVICLLLIRFARTQVEAESFSVKAVTSTDKEVLAYLLAYLLPIIAKDSINLRDQWLTALFVFAVIGLAMWHSTAFHFNPLLGLFGFHFYEVVTEDDMTYLLITPNTIVKQKFNAKVARLFDYTYLAIE